jgi:hypothetical protein
MPIVVALSTGNVFFKIYDRLTIFYSSCRLVIRSQFSINVIDNIYHSFQQRSLALIIYCRRVNISVVKTELRVCSVVTWTWLCWAYFSAFIEFRHSFWVVEFSIGASSMTRNQVFSNIRKISWIVVVSRPWNFVIAI